MTLSAIAATTMSFRLSVEIKRTQMLVNANKLQLALISVPFWSMAELKRALPSKPNNPLKISFPHLLPSSIFSKDGILIKGQLIDLQAKFNINMLKDSANILTLVNLLLQTNPQMNQAKALEIANATSEWIKPKKPGQENQQLEGFYKKQTPSYFMSHQTMVSLSEWRLVKGVTQQIYNNTSPYLVALPPPTKININSVSLPVLMALNVPKNLANKIIEQRKSKPFTSTAALNAFPEFEKLNIDAQAFSITSNYFLAIGMAKLSEQTLTQYTTLELNNNTKKLDIQIIAQSLNSY